MSKRGIEARMGKLTSVVADLGADGLDELETAVYLESLGIDDHQARGLGTGDVFELARRLGPQIARQRRHPELTVAMPAYNTEQYIGQALGGVLAQEGIDFEVIVIDDGSTDETAAVVEAFQDPRVHLVRNPRNQGIAWCQQRILEMSRAPFITHVDSDDVVLPGALRQILDFARAHPSAAQVHAFYHYVDTDGSAHREQWRDTRRRFQTERRRMNYRKALLAQGTVINHLRTYRKVALREVGGFDPECHAVEDFEVALRLVERFEIRALPRFLYCLRRHPSRASVPGRAQALQYWWRSTTRVWSLVRAGAITYPLWPQYRFLLIGRFVRLLPGVWLPRRAAHAVGHLISRVRWALRRSLRLGYRAASRLVSPFATNLTSSRHRASAGDGPVVYYLWKFPSLSQTFVQREVVALCQAGLRVVVAAETRDGPTALIPEAKAADLDLRYTERPARAVLLSFLRSRPLATIGAVVGLFGTAYESDKTLDEDRGVLSQAVALAQIIRGSGAHVVHAPWADRAALVARVGARIAGVAYTVQARAHDLYRGPAEQMLTGNLRAARHIVTNAEYNRPRIESLLAKGQEDSIHVQYEGLDPARFAPNGQPADRTALRLLCVARLIEEKGLVDLLQACRTLSDNGVSYECRILGGSEEPLYTNYRIRLLRLHRALGIEREVVFLGALPFEEVIRQYDWADLFVLPCVRAENGGRDITPNVIMEAMAAGLPVISTRSGAIPELVRDGEGILVEPGDIGALAAAITGLGTDPGQRGRLGSNARRAAEERFDMSRNIRTHLELLTLDGLPPTATGSSSR
jgi:glycosyltransferase involved in cell wall biosynthesis